MKTRLKWSFFCAFLYVSTVAAQTSLETRLDRLLNDDFFQSATIGVAVYDLTDQKMLYTHNEKRLCRPASNVKLITTAAALWSLTPRYNFRTGLYHTGTIDEDGHLTGDIFLTGGFDPELMTSHIEELAASIKKAGIESISGNLYIDVSKGDTLHWGKAWSWDDDMEAFQPYMSPLPLNKGVARVRVLPAPIGQAPTIQVTPESSFITVVNNATTVQRSADPPLRSLLFNRWFAEGSNNIEISGVIATSAGAHERRISLKNPHGYVLKVLSEKILEQLPESDIQIAGTMQLPADAQNIGYATNGIMTAIRRANKESDNLSSEMLLYAMGYQRGARPATTLSGVAVVQRMFEQMGFAANTFRIVDVSGLSNQNYLTPEQIVATLNFMYQSPNFNQFRQSLAVAGVDGTLASRMRNTAAFRNVNAKTGSLTSVSALSGYVTARNGNLLAFSIMAQNFVERASVVAVNHLDKIAVALAE